MAVPISAVIAAVESAAAPEALVSLESTTYPGRTDDVVRPVLEASGLVARVGFNLGFSPERIDPENQEFGPETRQGDRRPHREMRTRQRPISANSSKRS
jgi:UDP-N-acetyl-D-mannosaminuronate dehydrogenase